MLKSPSPIPRPPPDELPTENIFTVQQIIRLHNQVGSRASLSATFKEEICIHIFPIPFVATYLFLTRSLVVIDRAERTEVVFV